MADALPNEICGLSTYSINDSGNTFLGSRASIVASGYVPAGTLFPGDRPQMRGSNWRDGSGRRWRLTKGWFGPGTFRLVAFRSKVEAMAFSARQRRERALAERIASLAKEVDACPVSAGQAAREFRFLAGEFVRASKTFMLTSDTIKLPSEDRQEIEDHLDAIAEIVEAAALTYDDTPRSLKAAELKKLRTRRDDAPFNDFLTTVMVEAAF